MNYTKYNTTTSAASHRLEEKQYGEEIFRNLHTIAMFNKPSAELVAMLSADMFVKPNTKAFSHVMHFLFTILVEQREFRKCFFWPIIDRTGETNFRTAAMQQMNQLIQKHQLALEPVKMHVVVLPGGLKFMKGLLEFTVIAMRETLARQAKGEDSVIKYPLNENCVLESQRTEDVITFCKSLDQSLVQVQVHLQKIQNTIASLSLDQPFVTRDLLQSWQRKLDAQMDNHIEPGFKKITTFAQECVAINDLVQKIATNRHKQVVAVDKDFLKRCQAQLCVWMPGREMQTTIRQVFATNEFNYTNVMTIFEALLPAIQKHIRSFDYRRLDKDVIQFESNIISKMCSEASALKLESDAQLRRLETYFDWAQHKYPLIDNKENQSPDNQSYHRSFISTPPIRMRPSNANAIMSTHLPWQFEEVAKVLPSSTKKRNHSLLNTPNRNNHNTSLNTSMQGRSNAITMLNMVRDRCTTRMDHQRGRLDQTTNNNLAASLHNAMKTHKNFASPAATASKATTSSSTSTFYTGLGASRMFTEKLFETSATVSPDTIILRQRCETNSVIHLQPPAFTTEFLRTSPSGRFIMPDSHPSRLLSADSATPSIEQPSSATDNTTVLCNTPLSHSCAADQTVMARDSLSTNNESSFDGSGSNATARKIVFSPEATIRMQIDDEEEALFNESDTVLQDITL